MTDHVLAAIEIDNWSGPFGAELRERARTSLERGMVLYFPRLAFQLDAGEHAFLTPSLSNGRAKNISLDPETGRLQGTSADGDQAVRLAAMMDRFGRAAATLADALLGYKNVERARTSYRPTEIEGRSYSPINDDRLLHVDAFPSRPMRGRRILRFFANIAPERSRAWKVGEPFEEFSRKFLPRVPGTIPGKSWLFEKLGVTHGRRSRYDELMLGLHDGCKLDAAYQTNGPREQISFPPNTCWMVYTDQVLHAASGGAFALEQTFHLDVASMAEPARSPLRVLERLTGTPLT